MQNEHLKCIFISFLLFIPKTQPPSNQYHAGLISNLFQVFFEMIFKKRGCEATSRILNVMILTNYLLSSVSFSGRINL